MPCFLFLLFVLCDGDCLIINIYVSKKKEQIDVKESDLGQEQKVRNHHNVEHRQILLRMKSNDRMQFLSFHLICS